jgi:hypothetical protein
MFVRGLRKYNKKIGRNRGRGRERSRSKAINRNRNKNKSRNRRLSCLHARSAHVENSQSKT